MEARPVCDRHELLERDVEPVARCERAGRKQRVAPPQLVPLHAGQRERDSLARLARSTGRSCTWTLRTRTSRPPGSARSTSPAPIDPDQRVPVATVPIPRSENTRSTYRRAAASTIVFL